MELVWVGMTLKNKFDHEAYLVLSCLLTPLILAEELVLNDLEVIGK